jgi:hypothetical protein
MRRRRLRPAMRCVIVVETVKSQRKDRKRDPLFKFPRFILKLQYRVT